MIQMAPFWPKTENTLWSRTHFPITLRCDSWKQKKTKIWWENKLSDWNSKNGPGLKQFGAQFYKCLLPAPKVIGKKNSYFLVQGMAAPHSHPGMSGIMTLLHQSPRVRWLSRGRRCAASPTASGAAPGRPTCIHPGTSPVLRSIFLHREIVLR